ARPGPERHQAGGRLLDPVPAGVYDRCTRCIGLFSRDIPPGDPRFLQGPAIPRRRFGDHGDASRTGYAQDGWAVPLPADYLDYLIDRFARIDRFPRYGR